ncbi:hypothetical protein [Sulfitobacter sp.]
MQKSGLDDTMGDLIVNALGGFIASLTGYVYWSAIPQACWDRGFRGSSN